MLFLLLVINGILDSFAINQFPEDNSKKKSSLNLRIAMFLESAG